MSGIGMYEFWQSPSLGKRPRSPVELRQDLQKSRDADAADNLDNLHTQKRYLSEVIASGLSKLNFNMPHDDDKASDASAYALMDYTSGMPCPIPPRYATYSIHTPNGTASPRSPNSSCAAPAQSSSVPQCVQPHQNILSNRSFSTTDQQSFCDASVPPGHATAITPNGSQDRQHQTMPQSPTIQQPVHFDYTPKVNSSASLANQERFASPSDTKSKLDLRKTALLRSLLIRTESNAKHLDSGPEEAWMDEDDDPMALSPTPELPEVDCDDSPAYDDAYYSYNADGMDYSSCAYQPQQPDDSGRPGTHILLQPSPSSQPALTSSSLPTAPANPSNMHWRHPQLDHFKSQHHPHHHQQDAPSAPEPDADLSADRLEHIRAKALEGTRLSTSDLETRPKIPGQFPALPHLKARPGSSGVMRRTSSHI